MAQLYHAYLDESGTHQQSEAVVVAGFVSNADQWEALSEAWETALDEWQIPMFHMSEFENRKGDFASWGDGQRHERLNHLVGLIKEHTFSSIAFAVLSKSFDEILSEKAKRLCGDAYGFASIGCWYNLAVRAKRPKIDGYIEYFMGAGCRGADALTRIYREGSKDPEWTNDTRMIGLNFTDPRVFPPLQAADILAYEINKQAQRQLAGNRRSTRYPLKQLNVPGRQWHYASDDEMRKVNDYLTDLWDRYFS